jgi:hypothetical protein
MVVLCYENHRELNMCAGCLGVVATVRSRSRYICTDQISAAAVPYAFAAFLENGYDSFARRFWLSGWSGE